MLSIVYSPVLPLVVVRVTPVPRLVKVTSAWGTLLPEGSVMVPVIRPETVWPTSCGARTKAPAHNTSALNSPSLSPVIMVLLMETSRLSIGATGTSSRFFRRRILISLLNQRSFFRPYRMKCRTGPAGTSNTFMPAVRSLEGTNGQLTRSSAMVNPVLGCGHYACNAGRSLVEGGNSDGR